MIGSSLSWENDWIKPVLREWLIKPVLREWLDQACVERMVNQACVERMVDQACVERMVDQACVERMVDQACVERMVDQACVERVVGSTCVERMIGSSLCWENDWIKPVLREWLIKPVLSYCYLWLKVFCTPGKLYLVALRGRGYGLVSVPLFSPSWILTDWLST